MAGYLHEIHGGHDVDRVIRELVSLEWLVASRRKGVWVYLTAGGPPTSTLVAVCAISSIEVLALPWAFVGEAGEGSDREDIEISLGLTRPLTTSNTDAFSPT